MVLEDCLRRVSTLRQFRMAPLGPEQRCYWEKGAGYRVPVPQGRYLVTLHLAEVQFKKTNYHVFAVHLEGIPVLEGFDLFEACGWNKPRGESFESEVTDGFLDIRFFRYDQHAMVAALEIERLP